MGIRTALLVGGVHQAGQILSLRAGAHFAVGTPGRVLDFLRQGVLRLGYTHHVILDEADRMLDMGFIHDIKRVLALLPKQRQNLLFSATYSAEIEKLARTFLHDPVIAEAAQRNTAAPLVSHAMHPVAKKRKSALLAHLIHQEKWRQVLVFTRTKHGANRLAENLSRGGIDAAAIHGNKSQSARTAALKGFKDGRISVLVATDIASRGLDIEQLPVVVNYELPNVPEDYIHRIGRTGRAGSTGFAVSLVDVEEQKLLYGIERLLRKKIPSSTVPGFEEVPQVLEMASTQPRPAPQEQQQFGRPRRRRSRPSAQARYSS